MPTTLHQLRSEQTRERLLDAAIALMDAKGNGQWSVHAVARAAGMTSGAVQHHVLQSLPPFSPEEPT